jgi:hypothetical protein
VDGGYLQPNREANAMKRKTTVTSLGLRAIVVTTPLLATLFAGSVDLSAQASTTRGFVVGAHLGGASIEPEDGDRSSAGGGGLFFGYGLNRNFQIFLQLDGSEFDVENSDVDGRWAMGHADLGLRYHFANSLRSWVPYVQGAVTGRAVGIDDATVLGQPETEVGFYGGALSIGGGLLFYFSQTFALDLQVLWSGGEFTDVRVDDVTVSGLEIQANSSRLNIGVAWWP